MSSIAVLIGCGIGNMLMTTPLIKTLSKHFPDVDILANTSDKIIDIFKEDKYVRNVYSPRTFVRTKYDKAFVTIWGNSTPFKGLKYDKKYEIKKKKAHKRWTKESESEINYSLLSTLDIKDPMPSGFAHASKKLFPEFDYIIHAGAKAGNFKNRKWWPYYPELAEQLDGKIAIVGGPTDPKLKWPSNCTDYTNKVPLVHVGSLIKHGKITIANDSGIAHYSVALGQPTYIIYGYALQTKNRPVGSNYTPISKGLKCQPCQMSKRSQTCNYECLKTLSIDEVIKVIKGA